ncbi:MAG: serine/threonine protein kinase, partial [Actinobacteria bacterium]|nr:serine/threonine protein kinase [Actinomycetota bacterium]
MAEVWLATDTFLHRDVAVKLLKPHLANDEDAAERFRREAKACAGITHPNIVAVYDCLDYQGQQAVVMQYVKGKSLRDILDRQKRLGPKLTVHIGVSIAAALAEAHARGIIHRDVKPGNILVTPQGRVLLADFGIAKEANPSERDLTSDNIMIYECLAGRVPFLGESDADTALARLQREPTDLGRLRPSLSPQLVKVIHKLIARHPDDRFATGTEARAALTAALTPNVDLTKPIVQPATTGEYVVDDEGELALTTVIARTASSTPQRGLTRRDARRNGIRLLAVLASVGILAATILTQIGNDNETVAPQETTPVEVAAPTVATVQSIVSF